MTENSPSNTVAPNGIGHAPFAPWSRSQFNRNFHNPPYVTHRTPEDAQRILEQFRNETGFICTEEAGLRRHQCPPQQRPDVPMVQMRGCEIFLGRLPKDLLEDEIYALCKPFGDILEIRLMLEPHPQQPDRMLLNRGYAFVLFRNRESAKAAIETLDRKEIRTGCRIGAKKSVDNCRLFVGGLLRDKSKEDFDLEIRKFPCCGNSMRKVIMYPAISDKTKNRGFAFVEFSSHRDAAIARRQLMREKAALWGKEICVDWAQPEPEVDQTVMDQVRVVYVRNLSTSTTEETLHRIFREVAENGPIEKIKKLRDFAFVHFENRTDAQRAIETLNGIEIDGCQVEVMWAKPPSSARIRQQNFAPQNGMLRTPGWHSSQFYRPSFPLYGTAEYAQPMPFIPAQPGVPSLPAYSRNFMPSPQRHYRNAAGTRRTYGRQSGYQTPNTLDAHEIMFLPNQLPPGFVDTYGHYIQEPFNGYPSYYNATPYYGVPARFPSSGMQSPHPHMPHQMPVNEVLAQVYMQLPNLSLNAGPGNAMADFPPLQPPQFLPHSGHESQQIQLSQSPVQN